MEYPGYHITGCHISSIQAKATRSDSGGLLYFLTILLLDCPGGRYFLLLTLAHRAF